MEQQLIILGSGPAGYTAAVYAARANLKPLLITGLEVGGQLTTTTEVENWPGDFEDLQGPDLMVRMQKHAEKYDVDIRTDYVKSVDLSNQPLILQGEKDTYKTKSLIIATGASAKYLGLESEKAFLGKGVSACATCDGFFYKDQEVAVVGGGNTALEEALYLSNICSKVYLIHRRDEFRGEKILQDRVYKKVDEGKISLILNSTLKEVLGDGAVSAINILNNDGTESNLSVEGVFIAIGHTPNTDIFKDKLDMKDGYIITKTGFDIGSTQSCVTPVYLKGSVPEAFALVKDLRENYKIFCSIVIYPVIPKGLILLRLIHTASHNFDDIEETLDAFSSIRDRLVSGVYKKISEKLM